MPSILNRHRTNLRDWTSTVTRAQADAIAAEIGTLPAAKANPELAATLAAAAGFSVPALASTPGEQLLKIAGE